MKFLHLLRHAKSSWKDPGLNDHDRPLSKRGRQTAKMMAAYLRRAKIAPDLVICSTAMRAQQTLSPIAKRRSCPKSSSKERSMECERSNRHTVSIELVIFVIAALTGAQVSEIVDELDRRDPLDHLEA